MNCTSDIKKAIEFGNGVYNGRGNKCSNNNNNAINKTLGISAKTSASSNTRNNNNNNTNNKVNTILKSTTNAKCKKGYTDICKINATCSLLHSSNNNNNDKTMSIHNHSLKQIKQKHNCCINNNHNNLNINQIHSYCGNRPNSVAKMKYSQKPKINNRII
jgi:hypothetical protein